MATRALAGALVSLVALAAAAPASSAPRGDPTAQGPGLHASAKKKHKKRPKKVVACKKPQVRVNIAGRVTCSSVNAALPAPKETDQRLVLLQSSLGMDLGPGRDKRGRSAPSLARMFGRLGPGALAATKRFLPRAVSLGGNAAALATGRAGVAATAGCQRVNTETKSFSQKSGSYELGVTLTADSLVLTVTGPQKNGQIKRVELELDPCKLTESIDIPACPTARGEVDAKSVTKVTVRTSLLEDGKAVDSFTFLYDETTTMHGQVADDAQLDYVDIDDTQVLGESSPARGVLVGAASVSGTFKRQTRVNMRVHPEQYVADQSSVDATASLGGIAGLLVGGSFRENAIKRLKRISDTVFADVVKRAIDTYRERESGWNQPNSCAKLEFDPADTAALHKSDHGQFTGRNIATRDNGDPGGRWTLTASANATIAPATAEGGKPSFTYDVQNAGRDIFVVATFHVVSKAGVAEGTWKQPTVGDINTITGTFTGHAAELGVIYDWTGSATFARVALDGAPGPGGVFQLTTGQATVTVSGSEVGSGCDQTGTSTIGLFGQSPWTVTGAASPFSYQVIAPFLPDPPQAINVNCINPASNGTSAGLGSMPVAALQSGDVAGGANPAGLVKTTDDLAKYSGSASATGPGADQTESWAWSFTGSP